MTCIKTSLPLVARRGAMLLALAIGAAASLSAAPAARADDVPGIPVPAVVSAENAARQAALVAAEDRRLTELRTVASLSRWQGKNWKTPYRLSSGTGYTLVLTPSSVPYTLKDLQKLAPQTLLRMSDGSYLLTENIVVAARATLHLSAPGGLTLRLASGSNGFATLVSFGGKVELAGEQGAPLTITSWDVNRAAPDLQTVDGRAYVRAIGGQFEAKYVRFSHLGFWSGRTGGLSLTGQDRPNTGAIESLGQNRKADNGVPSLLDDVSEQPAGPLQEGQAPTLKYTVPSVDYVSTRIADTTIDGDAFGLFVSGANGVQIDRSTIRNSSIAGVVLHRYVTNGAISKVVSEHNVGDGIVLDRATTGITINESTARSNSGSGFSMSGRALAEGPSAAGSSLANYGNSSIANSVASGNGHYGIEVTGGYKMGLQNNRVLDNDMGIVVTGPATDISITGNTVRDVERHGIALLDGVTASTMTGNVVDHAGTGIYLRESSAEVKGNTVQGASSHGVSLVGSVSGTKIDYNVLAGSGPSALDTGRSNGHVERSGNQTGGWHDTSPWYFLFKKLLHPMTALWTLIALLVLTSAVRGRGRAREIEHPYAHQQIVLRNHLLLPSQESVVDLNAREDTVERGRHARERAGTVAE
jgi:parallel beta-helix repeat protein